MYFSGVVSFFGASMPIFEHYAKYIEYRLLNAGFGLHHATEFRVSFDALFCC